MILKFCGASSMTKRISLELLKRSNTPPSPLTLVYLGVNFRFNQNRRRKSYDFGILHGLLNYLNYKIGTLKKRSSILPSPPTMIN